MTLNMRSTIALYLDQDCVLADFNAGLAAQGVDPNWDTVHLAREDMTPAQIAHDDEIREVMAMPGFFEWLNPMPDARELWEFCSRVDPGFPILTARPSNPDTAERVKREKRAMIHREFGPIPDSRFICCLRAEKRNYVRYRPAAVSILVDDSRRNCADWADAGGYAVQHETAEKSIGLMKVVINQSARMVPA